MPAVGDGYGRLLWFNTDRMPTWTMSRKGQDVPVGQTKAAMRFRAPHILRFWGPMDTVAGAVEANPCKSHRIIRAGRNNEFLPRVLLRLRVLREKVLGRRCSQGPGWRQPRVGRPQAAFQPFWRYSPETGRSERHPRRRLEECGSPTRSGFGQRGRSRPRLPPQER